VVVVIGCVPPPTNREADHPNENDEAVLMGAPTRQVVLPKEQVAAV
jgi:hypothetical protein